MPYNEQIFVIDEDDETTTSKFIPRETLRRVSAPQAYRFDLLDQKYHETFEKKIGIYGSHYTNTMMVELGVKLNSLGWKAKYDIKTGIVRTMEMLKAIT